MKKKKSNIIKLISLDLARFMIVLVMIFILSVRALSNQTNNKSLATKTVTNDNYATASVTK